MLIFATEKLYACDKKEGSDGEASLAHIHATSLPENSRQYARPLPTTQKTLEVLRSAGLSAVLRRADAQPKKNVGKFSTLSV